MLTFDISDVQEIQKTSTPKDEEFMQNFKRKALLINDL